MTQEGDAPHVQGTVALDSYKHGVQTTPDIKTARRFLGRAESGEEGGVDFNPVPEILKTQVLIGCVLIVVVISNGKTNRRSLVRLLKEIHWNAAARPSAGEPARDRPPS